MQVKEIMTRNPAVCSPETSLQEVARMMVEHDCGAIPVIQSSDSNTPLGIITDRDITCRTVAQGKNPLEMRVGDVMTPNVLRVSPNEDVENLVRLMEKNQVRRVVVTDEQGCIGIVSQADVARHLSDAMVGEVVEDISRPGRGPSSPAAHMHNGNHISRGRPSR